MARSARVQEGTGRRHGGFQSKAERWSVLSRVDACTGWAGASGKAPAWVYVRLYTDESLHGRFMCKELKEENI